MMYVAGLSYKIIGGILGVAIPLVIVAFILITQTDIKIIDSYQKDRIMSWMYPEDETYKDDVIQQQNSITAIGSGELTGKGYNNNKVSSANKGNFVTQIQTDFIFAVAGEELGFIGSVFIILLLFLIVVECIITSRKAKDLSGKIICCGVAGVVGFQSFLNICVATRRSSKHRNTASLCKLWSDISGQSVYWYGSGIKRRFAKQKIFGRRKK